jgi:hypothetical protein
MNVRAKGLGLGAKFYPTNQKQRWADFAEKL